LSRYGAEELRAFATACFAREGMPEADAACVADALVTASLRGVDTHGVVRIPAYLKRIRAGLINVRPSITRSSTMPFATVIDADNAMGPVGAKAGMDACLAAARTIGIGVATVRRSNHFGAASVYTVPAAETGCIAIAMSPGAKTLAPHGARAPLFGTNPIAVAAPAGRFPAWSLDIASSVASRGYVRIAAQEGKAIPEGWALDAEGRATTDPEAALRGTMLPFGGAKGSGLAMMVDIMAGVLTGSAFAGEGRDWNADFSRPSDVGHFFLAMRVEAFMPLAEFTGRMETAIERMKALPPAEGFSEVNYPGERSGRMARQRRETGIPLTGEALESLKRLAVETGIAFPQAMPT
jgi:LDH2 family malate/lactate/ureidoglycolate dehydrogenase